MSERESLQGLQLFPLSDARPERRGNSVRAYYWVQKGYTPCSVKIGDTVNLDGKLAKVTGLTKTDESDEREDMYAIDFEEV